MYFSVRIFKNTKSYGLDHHLNPSFFILVLQDKKWNAGLIDVLPILFPASELKSCFVAQGLTRTSGQLISSQKYFF